MFDDPVAHACRQKIDNGSVDRCRRGKRPAFDSVALHNLYDLIGELFVDAPIGFGFQLRPLRDRICMTPARAITHRKASSQIAYLVDQSPVRIRDIERLYQL